MAASAVGQAEQITLPSPAGLEGFIADFYCHKARLSVEVDGRVHDTQSESDAERDAILTARGLRLLRITNTAVDTQILTVLARIKATANMKASP